MACAADTMIVSHAQTATARTARRGSETGRWPKPMSMPSRLAAIVLVVLASWTPELSATLILAYRGGGEVIIAADSVRTVSGANTVLEGDLARLWRAQRTKSR